MTSILPILGFLGSPVAFPEGNSGNTAFTFTVVREGDNSSSSTVQWAVTSTSATGDDFAGGILPQGSLSFGATESQKTITVLVRGDVAREEDELFSLALFNPIGASLRTSSATNSLKTASGGYGVTEYTYIVAAGGDILRLTYDMLQLPDRADIYINERLAASTNGFVSGAGSLSLGNIVLNANDTVKVRVTGNDPKTAWSYTINYPGLISEANYITSGLIQNDDQYQLIREINNVALFQSATAYLIAVNGSEPVQFFFDGQPVSASTFPGIAAIGATIVNGTINILWRDDNNYFSWVLNSKQQYIYDGISRSLAGSYNFFRLEAQFGFDINNDGITAIAAYSGVALLQSASAYLISVNGSSPVALSIGGQTVSPSTYQGWAAIGATIVNGVTNVLWRNGSTFLAWAVDASGVYLGDSLTPRTIANTMSTEFFALEAQYGIDINNNGISSIAVYGGVALLQSASAYLISVNGGDPVQFFFNGQPVSASSFPGIAAIGATIVNGTINILWRDDNNYFSWVLNSKQQYIYDGISRSLAGSYNFFRLEAQFGADINNDGISCIAAYSGVALLQSASAYLISVNGSSPVALSIDGKTVSPSTYQGWAAIGATIVNGVTNVLWRNGSTFLAWAVDASGVYRGDSLPPKTIADKSLDFFRLEAQYGIDINNDGISSIAVYGGVALLQSASAYLISVNGGDPVQFFFNGQPVSASSFPGIVAIGAATVNGAINILWNDGNDYFSWVLNSQQQYIYDGAPRSLAGSYNFFRLEAQFGADINNDVISCISTYSGVALLQSASAYLISVNGSSPVALSIDGKTVSPSTYQGWAAIGATIVNGVTNLLWRNGSTFLAWAISATGVYVRDSLPPRTIADDKSLDFFRLEAQYGIDINNDGISTISVYGGVALLQSASAYLISVNGSVPSPFTFEGKPVSASTFPGFVAIGAATVNGAINILWRNGNTLLAWALDAQGSYVKDSLPAGSFDNYIAAFEQLSGIDISLDGTISATSPTGTNASNIIIGSPNNDRLSGLGGNDFILGLAGLDTLDGGAGIDTMDGGRDDDLYIVDHPLDSVTEETNDPEVGGYDEVISSASYILKEGSNIEYLTLTGKEVINGRGNSLDNWVWGNTSANLLEGLDGDDLLDGISGFDTLSGGNGSDVFLAFVDGGTDIITDFTPGTDELWINTKLRRPDGYEKSRPFSANEVNFGTTAQFTASSQLVAYGSSTGQLKFREASNIVDTVIAVLGVPGGSHPQLSLNDLRLI